MITRYFIATLAGCVTFTYFGAEADTVQVSGGDQPTKTLPRTEAKLLWKQLIQAGGRVVADPEQPVLAKGLDEKTLNAARASLAKLGLLKAS